MFKYFYISFAASIAGISAAYYYAGWHGVAITAILSVLEVCLSLENAVVNAIVLRDMAQIWRERFLTWGILIAVFGMRLVFPVVLVAAMTSLNPIDVLDLALEQPQEYARHLTSAHAAISAFGGMFLLMVFLEFILDHKREIHWLGKLEEVISQVGNIEAIGVVIGLLILLVIQHFMPADKQATILVAGISGMSIYVLVHGAAKYMNQRFSKMALTKAKKAGAASFVYLEFLDASFSFDGVIGAFAITKDIVFITLGLGVGAFFVRSLTIFLVERKTIQKYIYLEHGAYYALGSLAVMMLLGIYYHVPEVLIAGVGAIVISMSLISSIRVKKKTRV